ncbi:hypothetical protein [Streptomyces europaeiscabiei]|nr:hypothetical protein [Streptomyces europaeiscabiei]
MNQKHIVGNYAVIGKDGDWRVMEQFGSYRILKKKFKSLEKAIERAKSLA